MHTVLQDAHRLINRRKDRIETGIAIALTLTCMAGVGPAQGQVSATVKDKKNVVKYSHNNLDFLDAPLQQALNRGDYLVTGARDRKSVV